MVQINFDTNNDSESIGNFYTSVDTYLGSGHTPSENYHYISGIVDQLTDRGLKKYGHIKDTVSRFDSIERDNKESWNHILDGLSDKGVVQLRNMLKVGDVQKVRELVANKRAIPDQLLSIKGREKFHAFEQIDQFVAFDQMTRIATKVTEVIPPGSKSSEVRKYIDTFFRENNITDTQLVGTYDKARHSDAFIRFGKKEYAKARAKKENDLTWVTMNEMVKKAKEAQEVRSSEIVVSGKATEQDFVQFLSVVEMGSEQIQEMSQEQRSKLPDLYKNAKGYYNNSEKRDFKKYPPDNVFQQYFDHGLSFVVKQLADDIATSGEDVDPKMVEYFLNESTAYAQRNQREPPKGTALLEQYIQEPQGKEKGRKKLNVLAKIFEFVLLFLPFLER